MTIVLGWSVRSELSKVTHGFIRGLKQGTPTIAENRFNGFPL